MPPRPDGTNGSDFAFRMTIENRYKRQAETRKLMQKLAKLSVRSLRRCKGASLVPPLWVTFFDENAALAGAAVAALLVYLLGSGATPLLRENARALQVYIALQLLIAVLAARDAGRMFASAKGSHADARAGALLARGLAQELKLPQETSTRCAWCVELALAACTAMAAVAASKAGSRFLRIQAAADPKKAA